MNPIYAQHLKSEAFKKREANKKLNSDISIQQRELLKDFADFWNKNSYEFMNDFHIDEFMKENKL